MHNRENMFLLNTYNEKKWISYQGPTAMKEKNIWYHEQDQIWHQDFRVEHLAHGQVIFIY